MSKAILPLKNFTFREMMNLVCYGHKYPEVLTYQQRITRLYRACLRRQNISGVEGLQGNIHNHFDDLRGLSQDFYRLNDLSQNLPQLTHEQVLESQRLQQKWEKWLEDNYEPHGYLDECRPYASTSSRYKTFPDNFLKFDPFGFYKPRLVSDNRPSKELPFYEDYPQNDHSWLIDEYHPNGLQDSNREKEHLTQ